MGAGAPVVAFGHAEPALLLQKVEEHDLAHELLGEVHRAGVPGLEFLADDRVLGGELPERRLDVTEQRGVLVEEFPGNGLDAEGFLDLGQLGVILGVLEQPEKAGLRGVATLALADDVGEAAGRRQPRLDTDLAGLGFDGGILHLDEGEAPLAFGGGDERHEGGVFAVALLEVVGDEVADGGAGALQLGIAGQVDDQHVELFILGRGVSAKTLETGDVGLESVFDIGGTPRLRLRLVELVEQVAAEFEELGSVERLREGFGDAGAGLLGVHNQEQERTEERERLGKPLKRLAGGACPGPPR